jgi:hypothetical protein
MDWPVLFLDRLRRRTSRLNRRDHAPRQAVEAPARHRFDRGQVRLLSGSHRGGSLQHPPLNARHHAAASRRV